MNHEQPDFVAGPIRSGFAPEGTRFQTDEDGKPWVEVTDISGWDNYQIEVLAAMIEGQPCLVGVKIEPRHEKHLEAISGSKLRRLPIPDLTKVAVAALNFEEVKTALDRMTAAAERRPVKHDARASTTVEQVVEAYLAAVSSGSTKPRKDTAFALGVSTRTLDPYLAKARKTGLLPAYNRKKETSSE